MMVDLVCHKVEYSWRKITISFLTAVIIFNRPFWVAGERYSPGRERKRVGEPPTPLPWTRTPAMLDQFQVFIRPSCDPVH